MLENRIRLAYRIHTRHGPQKPDREKEVVDEDRQEREDRGSTIVGEGKKLPKQACTPHATTADHKCSTTSNLVDNEEAHKR